MAENAYLCVGNAGKGPDFEMSDECLIGAKTGFAYCGGCQAVRRKFALAGKTILTTIEVAIDFAQVIEIKDEDDIVKAEFVTCQ